MRPAGRRDPPARRAVCIALTASSLLLAILFLAGRRRHTPVLVALNAGDRILLGLPASFGVRASARNPWSSGDASRSPGCGGRVNPSARAGDFLRVRYVVRDANGSVADSTRERRPATILLGSGQGLPLARALAGLCAGESASFALPSGGSVLVAVVAVGTGSSTGSGKEAAEAEDEDRLARSVTPVAAHRRRNCDSACAAEGKVCDARAFAIVNDCTRLRKAFKCAVCETAAKGSAGKDMPCFVSRHAPRSFPRGYCLASPVVGSSVCSARHPHTSRLCPCVDGRGKP